MKLTWRTWVVYLGVACILGVPHLRGLGRGLAIAGGVLGFVIAWWDFGRQYRAEWRSEGVEHHSLERAGFYSFVIMLVGLYVYGVVCHWAHWRPIDPTWFVAVAAYVFVLVRLYVNRRELN